MSNDKWKSITRHNVLGVGISALSFDGAVSSVLSAVKEPGFVGYVTVTGVHGVVESQADEELKKIHNQSFLSTADGMPMVWMGLWSGHDHVTRVYGPDLMKATIEQGAESRLRHYFFGGAEGVAQKLEAVFAEQAEIVGTYTPPFRPLTEEEELSLLEDIMDSKPHCLWVGLSTPKQERFMHGFISKYRSQLENLDNGLVFFGVGAAFDFHTGAVKQAPKFIQKSGFEWLYRTCMEPRRLWKRYAVNNTKFLMKIFPQMMGITKYELKK